MNCFYSIAFVIIVYIFFFVLHVYTETNWPHNWGAWINWECTVNTPLIWTNKPKNKYWIKLCMKCCTLSHCWGIYALCSRRSKCPSDILPYDHRALWAMACHGLVFLISKTRFLASFLFLLQGVLLGWASRNSLSVFIKRRNPISKSFPKEFLSYYKK